MSRPLPTSSTSSLSTLYSSLPNSPFQTTTSFQAIDCQSLLLSFPGFLTSCSFHWERRLPYIHCLIPWLNIHFSRKPFLVSYSSVGFVYFEFLKPLRVFCCLYFVVSIGLTTCFSLKTITFGRCLSALLPVFSEGGSAWQIHKRNTSSGYRFWTPYGLQKSEILTSGQVDILSPSHTPCFPFSSHWSSLLS